jgi:Asp-tRNA(Asn)/Glu-tRNA(Gln) amidotransferase A subunit family amidase
MNGVMPLSESLDHLGIFCEDPSGIDPMMQVLCQGWDSGSVCKHPGKPVLGIPDGPYLQLAAPHGLQYFEGIINKIQEKGFETRRIRTLDNIEEMNDHLLRLMWVEIAEAHAAWFKEYGHLYSAKMTDAVRQGQEVGEEEHERFMSEAAAFRRSMEDLMASEGIDAWICPSTTDSAPEGFESTGSPIMNFPWTYGGFPVASLPVGKDDLGLPHGLQVVGAFDRDEVLVARAQLLYDALY